MKSLENLARVYIGSFIKLITRNSRTFVVPKNRRNLNYDQFPSLLVLI